VQFPLYQYNKSVVLIAINTHREQPGRPNHDWFLSYWFVFCFDFLFQISWVKMTWQLYRESSMLLEPNGTI